MKTFEQISAFLIRSQWFEKYQSKISFKWKIDLCPFFRTELWVCDRQSLGK